MCRKKRSKDLILGHFYIYRSKKGILAEETEKISLKDKRRIK